MIRNEIQSAVKQLGLSERIFKEVGKYQWRQVIKNIEDTFICRKSHMASAVPYWNNLKGNYALICFEEGNAFQIINNIVDVDEKVWFLAQDINKVWLYEGTVKSIIKVIGECCAFEYYLASKKLSWLLCENHHGCLMGVGETVVDKMRILQSQISRLE